MATARGMQAGPRGSTLYLTYVLSIAACLTGNLIVRLGDRGGWLPGWGQVTLGIVSVLPLATAAFLFWRLLRRDMDEMLQRIVLEGLAFGLIVYIPLAGLYANLRSSGAWTPRLDAPDLLLAPAVLVAIGIALARRRYS